jgi:hypothetical protein
VIAFDIKDLYFNIPIHETLNITKTLLLEHNNENITKQIISLLDIILQRNYFISQNNIYQPEKGSPISGIVAEIFLHLENTHLSQIREAKNIVFYTRYVDGIFIIYDTEIRVTSPETNHNYMNKLHPSLEFTPTQEHYNSISFLDLLTTRHPSTIETDIHRNPMKTDTTINFTSIHPTEYKLAAYRYQINRMIYLQLTPDKGKKQSGRQSLP